MGRLDKQGEKTTCIFCHRQDSATKTNVNWFANDPKPTMFRCSCCKEEWYEFLYIEPASGIHRFALIRCVDYENLQQRLAPDFTAGTALVAFIVGNLDKGVIEICFPNPTTRLLTEWAAFNKARIVR